MSRGPGRIERAIRSLFDANPDLAFVTVELIEHCFPGFPQSRIERKHEVSVLRAAHKIVAEDADWQAERCRGQGTGWIFYNAANVQSFALSHLIKYDRRSCYHSPQRAARGLDWRLFEAGVAQDFISERVGTRAELLAKLKPGGREYDYIQPGGAWHQFVEEHIARRDGDDARVAAIKAQRKIDLDRAEARLSGKRFAAAPPVRNETLTVIKPACTISRSGCVRLPSRTTPMSSAAN